jgi:hypothetical protein
MKIKPPSEFVKAGVDIHNGDTITIKDEGEYRKLPQDPSREVLTFKVELPSGDVKKLTINPTSQIELIKAWTDDSKQWIDKKCRVEIVKQKVFDKMKEVIYLSPVEGKTPEPPPEEI